MEYPELLCPTPGTACPLRPARINAQPSTRKFPPQTLPAVSAGSFRRKFPPEVSATAVSAADPSGSFRAPLCAARRRKARHCPRFERRSCRRSTPAWPRCCPTSRRTRHAARPPAQPRAGCRALAGPCAHAVCYAGWMQANAEPLVGLIGLPGPASHRSVRQHACRQCAANNMQQTTCSRHRAADNMQQTTCGRQSAADNMRQ